MDHQATRVGVQQIVPAQVHINGEARPRERETDILDDEVITGHDLHSVDSLGTLSSSCHKSSQNSLLSDGFGSPGGEEHSQLQNTNQHHLHHHAAPPPIEEYDRSYAEGSRRGFLGSRSNSVATSNPGSVPPPKQHVYRQGSYSTQSWVRQQQMVAAQQFIYMPEDGNDTVRYSGSKQRSVSTKAGLSTDPQAQSKDPAADAVRNTAPLEKQAMLNNNNNNKRDEEFKSLTKDIDNSIDQLNQLIMDLDPTFMSVSNHSGSIKRNGGTHVNGSVVKCSNGIGRRFDDNNGAPMKNTQQQSAVQSTEGRVGVSRSISSQGRDIMDHPGFCNSGWGESEEYRGQRTYSPCVPQSQHSILFRSDSADYRAQGPDVDSGVEAGSDMTPPTPAFPISPPTPYVKTMQEFTQLRSASGGGQPFGQFRTDHVSHADSRDYPEISHVGMEGSTEPVSCHRTLVLTHSASVAGTPPQTDSSSMTQPWPAEHPVLTRHSSLSSYTSARPPPPHPLSMDYSHHSPPLHHPHIHPAPNAHSSPRSSQRSRMARYNLSRSPGQSFHDQDDSGLGYGTDCPAMGMDRDLLANVDGGGGQHRTQTPLLLQPPLLPEKKRASDGEHSLGTASPALSGFSSPHSGSSLSIPFPNVLPDLSSQIPGTASPLPDVLASKQVTVKFVQDTSKFWYKPDISRDQAISVLKDKEPGCFIVRDSHSFKGAYGLAMKVATPPPSVLQQSKKGGDFSNELVRHFLIECTQKGVRLKGCPNEPYFGSLTALVCQHSITPLALPCKLIIPDRDPLEDVVENTSQSVTNSAAELLKQGAACNVWFLGSVEMESLTGVQAVQKATTMTLSSSPPPTSTVVHFKVSSQGITLTDNQRKLFFRRHYNVNTVIFCALDPQDRKWKKDGCPSAKIFGFVARKTGTSTDNICHLFAEHDPEQPASAIVNFVSKVMIGSQRSK
ncbi:unnamed protein product [Ophioblennius macclurei]